MSRSVFTRSEMVRRWDGLRRVMGEQGIAAAVILQPRDLYYYAGVAIHGQLVIPADRDPVLLVQINMERAELDSWVTDIRPSLGWKTLKDLLAELGVTRGPLGYEEDVVPVQVAKRLQACAPQAVLVDLSEAILSQRMIKSPEEAAALRRAADLSSRSLEHIRGFLRGGMSELEGASELYRFLRTGGSDGMMIGRAWNQTNNDIGWLMTGPNTAYVSGYWLTQVGVGSSAARPYGPTQRPIRPGDLVAVDQAVPVDGYFSDEARTFVCGEPSDEQVRIHGTLVKALDAAIGAVRPGVPVSEVYRAARTVMEDAGLFDRFMTRALYDFEYLGHGIGLEMGEPPFISPRSPEVLQPGMVIALEPKVIIPGWGGMTVEDLVLVTTDSCEVLTYSSRELTVLPES